MAAAIDHCSSRRRRNGLFAAARLYGPYHTIRDQHVENLIWALALHGVEHPAALQEKQGRWNGRHTELSAACMKRRLALMKPTLSRSAASDRAVNNCARQQDPPARELVQQNPAS